MNPVFPRRSRSCWADLSREKTSAIVDPAPGRTRQTPVPRESQAATPPPARPAGRHVAVVFRRSFATRSAVASAEAAPLRRPRFRLVAGRRRRGPTPHLRTNRQFLPDPAHLARRRGAGRAGSGALRRRSPYRPPGDGGRLAIRGHAAMASVRTYQPTGAAVPGRAYRWDTWLAHSSPRYVRRVGVRSRRRPAIIALRAGSMRRGALLPETGRTRCASIRSQGLCQRGVEASPSPGAATPRHRVANIVERRSGRPESADWPPKARRASPGRR